jgi:DNA polymerase III alpha subunit
MAFVTIEDESGQFSLTVFPDLWRQCQALLKVGEPIAATVCVDNARTDRGIARSMWCNGKFFKVEHSKQAGRWVAA